MGQNNDTTEHGDLQGQQGVIKNNAKSAYLGRPDREGNNVFREQKGDRPGDDTANITRRPRPSPAR